MNVVFNSEHYSVLAYPAQESFELVDKESMRSLFIQGSVALQFRHAIDEVAKSSDDIEDIDEFLEEYCAEDARPIVFH